jgi:methyl-accepting chemotaxis protein
MTKFNFYNAARISVALPILFIILSATIVWLVAAVLLQARDQSQVLTEIADHDTKVRTNSRAVVVAAESLNTRLLGVLAEVYSAPGSVATVEKIFADLKDHWAVLAGHLEKVEGRRLIERAAQDLERLLLSESNMIEALRSGEKVKISKVYDDTLEPSVHFRRKLRELLSIVDQRGAKKIADVLSNSHWLETLAKYAGGLFLTISFLAGLYVVLRVARPLTAIIQSMKSLASNNLEIDVTHSERKDEIGDIARALTVFKASLVERTLLEVQNREAETAWRAQHRSELAGVADNLETTVGKVVETVNSSAAALLSAADTLADTVDGTQRLSNAVAIASTQTCSSIDRIAASTQELLVSAGEVRVQVDEASRVAGDAAIKARRASERITNLSSATNSIAEMAQAIAAIAAQTNLLALNATIEAARAGEAGRGFSVVASEVKVLAAQTALVTKEITSHIESMQLAGQESVADIAEITATVERLSNVAKSVSGMALGQQAATQEIAQSAQQVATGASDVAEKTSDVSRGATRTGSASAQVLAAAHDLSSEGRKLKDAIGQLAATIRAA